MAKANRAATSKKRKPGGFPPIRFSSVGERLTAAQINAVGGLIQIPDEFERFLLKTNRGTPDRHYFAYPGCTEDAHLDFFLGIDTRPLHDPRRQADCLSVLIQRRDVLPPLAIPIAFVDRDNLLLTFEWGPRHGQIWLKIWNPSPGFEPYDREADLHFVANSLTDFLHLLEKPIDEYRPAAFALDSPKVRGSQLEKLLKSIGCTKFKYKGVYSSTPLPVIWNWPKFRQSFDNCPDDIRPASLTLEKNLTYGYSPKYAKRPKGHAILIVNVTEAHRKECLKELANAFGTDAVLIDK